MIRRVLTALILMIPLTVVPCAFAQSVDSTATLPADTTSADYEITILPDTVQHSNRPKIGLVLSGGGAKGLAHIGVLKVLEEVGLDVDVVSGTSMGSIIGGLFAIGYTAEEIDSLVLHMDWQDFFSDVVSREHLSMEQKLYDARYLASLPLRDGSVALPNGLIPGQNFSMLLNRLTLFVHDTPNFRDLPRPFVCIATDLVSGKAVVLDHGQLSEAIRASMAIPSVFTPVPYQGSLLVDGGLVRNFPVEDALHLGADYIIGVNVGMPLPSKDKLTDILSIVNQSLSFIGAESDSIQKTMVDLLIEPDVAEYSITDFMNAKQIIEAGEVAARAQLPRLQAFADSINALGDAPPRPLPPRIDSLFIEDIQIRGLDHVTKRQVMADLALDTPRWVTTRQLEAAVDRVFSSQFFERVGYHLTSTQHGTILTLHVLEKQADFFRFGFRYDSFKKASVLLNLTANNLIWHSTMATFDLVLGEYTEMEAAYFFHTGYRPRIGMRLNTTYNQGEFTLPLGGTVGEVEMKYQASRSEILFGTIFSTSSVIGAGVRYNWALTRPRFSVPGVKRREHAYPSVFALFWGDTFDRADFAHEGISMLAEFEIADSTLAGTQSYQRGELRLESRTRSSDWLTLIGKLHFGSTSNKTPLARLFMNQPFQDQIAAKSGEYAGEAMQYVGYGFQIEPWHKRFIVLEADFGNTFADWESTVVLDRYDWGAGATTGVLTVMGPISTTVATGSKHDILFVLNVGFHF